MSLPHKSWDCPAANGHQHGYGPPGASGGVHEAGEGAHLLKPAGGVHADHGAWTQHPALVKPQAHKVGRTVGGCTHQDPVVRQSVEDLTQDTWKAKREWSAASTKPCHEGSGCRPTAWPTSPLVARALTLPLCLPAPRLPGWDPGKPCTRSGCLWVNPGPQRCRTLSTPSLSTNCFNLD